MTVTVHLPQASEAAFHRAFGQNLERAALEALSIEGYRAGKLSLGEVANALGLETSAVALEWLGSRGVPLNYSLEDLQADRETLQHLLGTGSDLGSDKA
jgi:predicted HTH domain antitoxin